MVKPDQLIKRRGKLGLVGVDLNLDQVKAWLKPRLGKEATVSIIYFSVNRIIWTLTFGKDME